MTKFYYYDMQYFIYDEMYNNTKIDNTKIDNTKIDNTKIDNTKIDNTKIDNTKIDNTKIDNTKIDKKEFIFNKLVKCDNTYKTNLDIIIENELLLIKNVNINKIENKLPITNYLKIKNAKQNINECNLLYDLTIKYFRDIDIKIYMG